MAKMVLLSCVFFLACSSMAADFVLLQTGKAFVKDIDEEKAKSIAENRDEVKKYSFDELKIKEGDSVDFRNVDSVKHNVVAEDLFNFVQPHGSKDKHKFTKKGSYNIRCTIHPKMKIKIVVD